MSVSDTVLVFVGIPAAILLLITVLSLAGDRGRTPGRYRPGRRFDFAPVWFLSSPDQVAETPQRAALPEGAKPALPSAGEVEIKAAPARPGMTGGASDRW
ncbi:MAG TPA: hypothetical protein VFX61_06930 [Micromonosporaceae bacterium]|nr:hypothetical protein [Micromonosporaceae bacterium]